MSAMKDHAINLENLAADIWGTLTADERFGVRCGLFPADKMAPTEPVSRDDLCIITSSLMRMATEHTK